MCWCRLCDSLLVIGFALLCMNSVVNLLNVFFWLVIVSPRLSNPPLSLRVCRGLFGSYGSLVHSTVRRLVFITVLSVLASLTVYYFNIRLDNSLIPSASVGE